MSYFIGFIVGMFLGVGVSALFSANSKSGGDSE